MTNALRNIRIGPSSPERVLLLIPGYGDAPEPFLHRVSAFDPDQRWLTVVVEPQHPSPRGPYWYDVDENGPDPIALASAIATIDELCATLLSENNLTEDELVVAGFSQGGALALAHLVDPNTSIAPGAVAALAAYLPSRDDHLLVLERAAHRPLLFAHGEDDELVEPLRGRSAAKAFTRSGAIVTWATVAGGHRFDQPLTDQLALWLNTIAQGDRPSSPPT
ncbi:MAG: hypothetical protein WEA11_03890 [Acidimicrobiales bacterium]